MSYRIPYFLGFAVGFVGGIFVCRKWYQNADISVRKNGKR